MAPNYGYSAPGAEWRRTFAPNYPGAELAPNSGAEWSWRRTISSNRDLLLLLWSLLTSQPASHPVAEFGSWSRMAGAEWSRMEPNSFTSMIVFAVNYVCVLIMSIIWCDHVGAVPGQMPWDLVFHPEIYAARRAESSRRRGESAALSVAV